MPAKFTAHLWVTPDGKLDRQDWLQLAHRVGSWANKRIVITLADPVRSVKQNAFYHVAYVEPITRALREAGTETTHEITHEWLARKYLPSAPIIMPDGVEILRRKSTTELTSSEFTEYLENIRADRIVMQLGLFFESQAAYERRTGTKVQ